MLVELRFGGKCSSSGVVRTGDSYKRVHFSSLGLMSPARTPSAHSQHLGDILEMGVWAPSLAAIPIILAVNRLHCGCSSRARRQSPRRCAFIYPRQTAPFSAIIQSAQNEPSLSNRLASGLRALNACGARRPNPASAANDASTPYSVFASFRVPASRPSSISAYSIPSSQQSCA